MRIEGIDYHDLEQLRAELARGGRFVFFEYCISCVALSLRRPSVIIFLPAGRRGWVRGLPYTLLTLALGWWGLPWGVIYTPLTLATNLAGGCDVTHEVWRRLEAERKDAVV